MPKITLNGKAPATPAAPRSAGKPVAAPQSFGNVIADAIATGNTVDPSIMQNAAFLPASQSNAWRSIADRAAYDRAVAAIQSVRRTGSISSDAVTRAQQGFSTIRSVTGGSLPPSSAAAEDALRRVIERATRAPSGGALVPYQGGGLPTVYRSSNTGFQMIGGPTTPNSSSTEVARYLGRIDASTRQSAKVETEAWNRDKQIVLARAIPMGGPGQAGQTYYGYGNAGSAVGAAASSSPFWGRAGFWQGAMAGMGGGMGPVGPAGPPLGGGGSGGSGGGGSGGGGGGGINRRARGYGWGKAISRIPYVGGAASNIIEAGALGGPWAAAAATAVEAVDFAAFHNQYIGDIANSVYGRAKPFIDFQSGAYALGRATDSASGNDVMKQFYDGWNVPSMMKAFGARPEDAMRDISRFGIVQDSASSYGSLFQSLNAPKYSTAYSAMNQDQVKDSARNAAVYGVVTGDAAGVTRYLSMLAPVMEGATARGMDRASILRSIDASVSGAASRGAAGIGVEGNVAIMGQFANLAGGRTGQSGLSYLEGLDNKASLVGSDPGASMDYLNAVKRYPDQGSLEKLLGHKLTPGQQDTAKYYFEAIKTGSMGLAAKYLSGIVTGEGQAEQTITTGPGSRVSMLPDVYKPVAIAGSTGSTINQGVQVNMGRTGGFTSENSGAAPGSVGATPASWFSDSKAGPGGDYETGLRRMGIRSDLIPVLIEEAQKAGINPLLAGAQMMGESRGGNDKNAGVNVMQVKGSSGLVRSGADITSERQSIQLGLKVDQWALKKAGGNPTGMFSGFEGPDWGTPGNKSYENAIHSALVASGYGGANGDPSNIPTTGNTVTSFAGGAGMKGSETSMEQGAAVLSAAQKGVELFSDGLGTATTMLQKFTRSLASANDSANWYRSHMPTGNPLEPAQ